MSRSRRPGGTRSRPTRRPPSPPPSTPDQPAADGARGWGYNVDYLIVARFGQVVPEYLRHLLGGTDQGKLDCREVGHRVTLPRDRHDAAQNYAGTFWLLVAFSAIAVFALQVIGVGAVNHMALQCVLPRIVSTLLIGLMTLAFAAALFAGIRRQWLDDPVVRRYSRQEVPGLATPKPYDWAISIAASVLGATAFWTGVADGIAKAAG